MIGGGIGGIYAGLSGLVRYSFVSPGLAAIPAFIGENPMNVVHALITIAISFAAGFAASWILGFDDPEEEGAEETKEQEEALEDTEKETKDSVVYSPLKGKVIPLEEVNDEVFSKGILGQGAAIIPEEGVVYAPFDGKIASVFDTKHAICLTSEDGVELLIHIGIDTVNLEGKPFHALKKSGDSIKKGDKILEFQIDEIKKAGYDTVTPVLVGNTDTYREIVSKKQGTVKSSEELIHVVA